MHRRSAIDRDLETKFTSAGAHRCDSTPTVFASRSDRISPLAIIALIGAWRSDDARANQVYVFERDRAVIVSEGECSPPLLYRQRRLPDGRIRVLFIESAESDWLVEVRASKREMLLPVGGDFGSEPDRFRRVTMKEVADHPCITRVLALDAPKLDSPAPPRFASKNGAAEYAARLADAGCDRKYGVRGPPASAGPIERRDGRWSWGMIDPFLACSATVSFEIDGTLPRVRVYYGRDSKTPDRLFILDD